MRIFNRQDFLKLPAGILYSSGKKWYFNAIHVKGYSYENDFIELDITRIDAHDSGELFDRWDEMLDKGASYPFDEECYGRNGAFDNEDIFMVFEPADLLKLKGIIDAAIAIEIPSVIEVEVE